MTPTAESVRPSGISRATALDPLRPTASRQSAQVRAWRRLRILAILLPVAFIVGLQLLRPLVSTDPLPDAGEALLDVVTAVAAIVFGLVIFRSIDRWQRTLLRTNRELAVRDAVATALRDASGDDIPVAAARSVREAAGAVDVLVELTSGERWDTLGRLEDPSGPGGDPRAGGPARADVRDVLWESADEVTSTVVIPLDAAGTPVGTMRVTLPQELGLSATADGVLVHRSQVLSDATVAAVGQQIGSAVHRAQLLARLERALDHQRAVSDLLVRLTSGLPLDEGLHAVVTTAQRLTGARDAGLDLETPARPDGSAAHLGTTRVRPSGAVGVPVRAPHGSLGELWILPAVPTDGARPVEDTDVATVLADLAELASVATEHARLLEDERGAAAVREREWIAREMHDSLAQVLGVLHLRLRSLEALLGAVPTQDAQRETSDLADIAHDAFVDVREAILGLRVSTAGDRSFLDALRSYAQKYERQSGLSTTVDPEGDIDLTPAAEVQVLRVVQEALTNVRKHARASRAVVRLRGEGTSVRVTVEDDGTGFDTARAGRFDSFGMSSMRERTELVGGHLEVDSAPGRGTRVSAVVPSAAHATTPPIVHPEIRGAR